jgi:hypothetical protein
MNSSLLTVITTIAEVGALAGLLWQLIQNRRESKTRFMIGVYGDLEDKLNRTIDDKARLKVYAGKRGISLKQAKERILATIDINDAFKNYLILKGKLIDKESGENFKLDAKELFKTELIENNWGKVKKFYPKDFQDFIDS